jgi:murein DD-endopeptidase MepM/ murein hydrolase activator NlpD
MSPPSSPRFVALALAVCVALIAPSALAGEGDEQTEPPPPDTTTTSTTVATTTTTTTAPGLPPAPPEDPPSEPPGDETVEPPDEEPAADGEAPSVEDELLEEEEIEFDPLDPEQVTRDIVFPVVGASTFSKGFGDCRDGCARSHNGIDILTHRWKGFPVVASHDGTVTLTRTEGRLSGCAVVLEAEDGWTSHYVHLNTDIPGTDTEADLCFAPGIEVGATVAEGTILGWIGDSGNAETTQPHLHFEIRNPDGIPVDAWYSLAEARRIEYSLVDATDLIQLAGALFGEDSTTAYVVDVADLFTAADASSDSYESPLVPIDPFDPQSAFVALEAMQPERIIVFTDNDEAAYLEDLSMLAPVVEVSEILVPEPDPPVDEATASADRVITESLDAVVLGDVAPPAEDAEALDPDDVEPVHVYEAEEPSTIIVVADRSTRTMDDLMDEYELLLGFVSRNRIPKDLGFSVRSHPGVEANRGAFWWQSSDGWLLSEDLPTERSVSIALVRDPEDTATLNFLDSLSQAPAMPLWHHQPTSRTTKSL